MSALAQHIAAGATGRWFAEPPPACCNAATGCPNVCRSGSDLCFLCYARVHPAAELPCLVCDEPVRPHADPEALCLAHMSQWEYSAERLRSPRVDDLLQAIDKLCSSAAQQPDGRPTVALAENLKLARAGLRAPLVPEAFAEWLERVRGERAAAERRAQARWAAKDKADVVEAEVKEAVSALLARLKRLKRIFYWRANAGGEWHGDQYVRANRDGTPDYIVVVRVTRARASGGEVTFGVFLGLELKRPHGGVQSEKQIEFEDGLRTCGGGFYALPTSAAEAEQAIEAASRLEQWCPAPGRAA